MKQREHRPVVQSRSLSIEERSHYSDLIDQLVAHRKRSGMSQAAMDHRLGVSEGMVAKWETATRLPGAFFLMCWCKALGVRLTVEPDKEPA